MKIRTLVALVAAVSLSLAGCASSKTVAPTTEPTAVVQDDTQSDAVALLEEFGLTGKDARQVIDHLDRLGGTERPKALMASIRADKLQLSSGERKAALDMPTDSFYVSVAPYETQTHECFYHSLTTCQGELANEDVKITVVNDATGETIVDEQTTTYANGFVGLWLPRDITGTITITRGDKSVTSAISTNEDSATCLTTLQMV